MRRLSGRLRRWWGRTTLRGRLLAGLLLLAAVGLLSSDLVGVQVLRHRQLDRIDAQLLAAGTNRGRQFPGAPADGLCPQIGLNGEGGTGTFGANRRLPTALLFERFDIDGTLCVTTGSATQSTLSPPQLPNLTESYVAAHDGRPFTVGAQSGGGQWRVIVSAVPGGGSTVVAQSLADLQSTTRGLVLIDLGVGGGVLILLGGLAFVVIRLGLRPLDAVTATADAIRSGDLGRRAPVGEPRTEVGRLGSAFNSMLEQMELALRDSAASAARLRQFAADASHELRTPLTSIRGFAELYRQGAVESGPDLDRVMRRIEDESIRMGTLVEDLLVLARLDQGRPLALDPVDLTGLLDDAVHDARAVDPAAPLVLEAGPASLFVRGDEHRLRQVATNLLANARVHTPPGTPVTVRAVPDGPGWVVLEVADRGPGLDAESAAHVFDRFWRADQARARGNGGAGLGLSIVAAIAAAHGGEVGVSTTPGEGATFRVRLPRISPP